jgi:hypothetical protein
MIHLVDNHACRKPRIIESLQCRIELVDEVNVRPQIARMKRNVEPWCANDIQIRVIVLGSEYPPDGNSLGVEELKPA